MEGHHGSSADLSSNRRVLEGYMNKLSDIRRSTTIICDSIRVRERNALSMLGISTGSVDGINVSNCEPIKCSICMSEFEDPCVAIKACGHGLHEKCMEGLWKLYNNGDNTPGGRSLQLIPCPLCRIPFRRDDVLRLVGMHPPTGQAALWRAVQLSSPWKDVDTESEASESTSRGVDSLPEKLFVSLRALFRQTNDLTRAFGAVLRLHEDAARIYSEAINEKNRIAEEMADKEARFNRRYVTKMKNLDERESLLLGSEYQNEVFIAQCLKAVNREGASTIDKIESMVVRQKCLDKMGSEIRLRREALDAAIKDFEEYKVKQVKKMESREDYIRKEMRRLASERKALALNVQKSACEMVNPAFSEPESSDSDSGGNEEEVVVLEDSFDNVDNNGESAEGVERANTQRHDRNHGSSSKRYRSA